MTRIRLSIFVALLVITALFGLTQCKKSVRETYPFKFRFITEEYKPFNYTENGELTGLAPEILRAVCEELDIPFEAEVLPWDQGYSQTLQTDNAVLFSTVLNDTRRDLFKWAGPIAALDWMFYSSAQNQLFINSLDDAKAVGKIGVLADYGITQYLVSQGFTNLVYCNNNIDAFDKLLKGEIDLFPSDKLTAQAALESLGKTYYAAAERLTIKTDLVYFAFNKNIPDNVIADFQLAIDKLKNNGTFRALHTKFMNSPDFPESFQVYTENYPPLTFRDPYGNITGFGSEIAKEIMKRNNMYSNIKLSLWSIGYELALNNPNFCLFTMDRTPARDSLFQWVGPLGTNTTYFFTKAGSGITINSLDEAKNLASVGVVTSWFSAQYLTNLGFTNLVSDSDPIIMAKKLMTGEINTFVCSAVTFPDILHAAGYQYNQVVPAFALMSSDYYIAFSKNTSPSVVSRWQTTLDAIKSDGTYQALSLKWLP
jgi:polar amino acid transport system substrate-binding protein